MNLDAKSLLVVGGAVALPALLSRSSAPGAHAGKANLAAATKLGRLDSLTFAVPSSASMVAAHRSMKLALAAADVSELSLFITGKLGAMWIDAYQAGAAADPVNYTLLDVNTGNGLVDTFGSTGDVAACDGIDSTDGLSPLGVAVCAVRNAGVSKGQFAEMVSLTGRLAQAMDDADFLPDGQRRSDGIHIHSITELPGLVASKAAGLVGDVLGSAAKGLLFSPLGLAALGVGGYLAWRHFK